MYNDIFTLIEKNDIKSVLDIGANCGNFSRPIKSKFPNIKIFMIEANPFCEEYIKATGIPYEIACLSSTEKQIKFFMNKNNSICTGSSYYQEQTVWYDTENYKILNTRTLDDVVTESFDLVKLDTQGSELDIMIGGKRVIDSAKFILIETSLMEYNKGAPLKKQIFEYLGSVGFKPIECVENHYHEGNLIQEDWIFEK